VLGNPNLGYALAFGMIVITGIANVDLHLAAHPLGEVAEMTRSGPGLAFFLGLALFPPAADRHDRILAEDAARRIFL
jgi:hypothetical protein